MADIIKPIYLVPELGEYAVIPDGSIINIGGVRGPTFTVGGKPLMFADGTSTGGEAGGETLQNVYDNTIGLAEVDFTSGKHFILKATNSKQFKFDADTGDVSIGGNLSVTLINGVDIVALNQQVQSNSAVQGFEYTQSDISDSWVIVHGKNTTRVEPTIWDNLNEQVLPDRMIIVNANTIMIKFNTPISGRAILLLF